MLAPSRLSTMLKKPNCQALLKSCDTFLTDFPSCGLKHVSAALGFTCSTVHSERLQNDETNSPRAFCKSSINAGYASRCKFARVWQLHLRGPERGFSLDTGPLWLDVCSNSSFRHRHWLSNKPLITWILFFSLPETNRAWRMIWLTLTGPHMMQSEKEILSRLLMSGGEWVHLNDSGTPE